MEDLKIVLLNELIRNGHSRSENGKVWDIAKRHFLYMTPKLAKGFLNMKRLERYKINIRARETNLIKKNSSKLKLLLGNEPINIIDVGCGDGHKAKMFIRGLNRDQGLRYCALNVSDYLVNLALENVKNAAFDNVYEHIPFISGFEDLSKVTKKLRSNDYKKNVILIFGSILAGYEINNYLFGISNVMEKGDYLVIGNGIRTGERLVNLDTYNNNIFNRWFMYLMKGLGFLEEEVEYGARFGNSRIEMFYSILRDKTLDHNGKKIEIKKGDEILVAILYKYFVDELEKFAKMYFDKVDILEDKEQGYALVVCKK